MKSYDYVEKRMVRFQTTVTAVRANRQLMDGGDVPIQEPNGCKEEEAYLQATGQASYAQMEQARTRPFTFIPNRTRAAMRWRVRLGHDSLNLCW